jgi:thioredoxin-related protein
LTRKIALTAALALIFATNSFAGWQKSVAAAKKAASAKNELILVDMYAQWCGWCHRFEQEVFPSAAFQKATDDMVLLRLDTEDNGEGTDMARKFGVSSLPTFLVLAPDLSLAGVIRGYAPPNQFVEYLGETRTKYAEFLKRIEKEPKANYTERMSIVKDLIARSSFDKAEPRLKKILAEKGVPVSIRDEAYYQLAVCYALQNKNTEGLKTIRQLTTMSKSGDSVERAKLLAGQIYLNQGNLLSAATEFRNFKSTYPNSPLIANVDSVLPEIERRLAGMK